MSASMRTNNTHKTALISLRLEALAQATRPVSLKLSSLVWASALQWLNTKSRLGETFLLGRHPSLPRNKVSRLGGESSKNTRIQRFLT